MTFLDALSIFLQGLLEAALPVLASLLVAWGLPRVIAAWQKLKAANPDEIAVLEEIASMAVHAAEQEAIAGYIEDRKAYALDVVQAYLAKYNIKVNVAVILAAIEAAVKTELNPDKRFVPPEG